MIGAIFLQVILIALNAVFASAEIAVISMNETKIKNMAEEGNVRAAKLCALTEQPARFLATIQVAITMASLLGSAYAADNFAGELVKGLVRAGVSIPVSVLQPAAVFLITLILAYFSLVFGELVPKRIAMKKADELSLALSKMLFIVSKVFAPIVWLLTASTNGILRLMGIDPNEDDDTMTEEELRMMLAEGNKKGVIRSEENDIIQNVFEFDDRSAEQVCTRRKDVIALSLEDDMEEWRQIIYENRHTYYPVYREEPDDVMGVLDTRDYFRLKDQSRESVMKYAVEKAVFIPETMKANTLFYRMKQTRQYFVIVIDEYGGMSGIVTLHDLVEALMGEILDVGEIAGPAELEKLGDGVWKIQGSAPLDEVAEELKLKLPEEDYETFNGFVCDILGRIPDDGEQLTAEYGGMQIEVRRVEGHVIQETIVRVSEPARKIQEDL